MMIFIATLVLLFVETEAWFPSYYPQYCTKDLSKRKIPPLTASQLALVNELEQVQVIVRHGARTPYAKFSCWKDYDVTWNNCNVTELMLASPSMTDESRPAPWLFRKLYDGSPNFLGGNCFTGQLLSDGYTQEEAVGSSLLEAYLQNSNPALNLFNTSVWTDIDTDEEVYLRSDDEQRTLMSGQILMHTFFNVSFKTSCLYRIFAFYLSLTMYRLRKKSLFLGILVTMIWIRFIPTVRSVPVWTPWKTQSMPLLAL